MTGRKDTKETKHRELKLKLLWGRKTISGFVSRGEVFRNWWWGEGDWGRVCVATGLPCIGHSPNRIQSFPSALLFPDLV